MAAVIVELGVREGEHPVDIKITVKSVFKELIVARESNSTSIGPAVIVEEESIIIACYSS